MEEEMTDIRNIELKTISKVLSSNLSQNIGGQVPAAMKRWVTFVAIDTKSGAVAVSNLGVYLASVGVSNPSKASIVATGNRKLLLMLRATKATKATAKAIRGMIKAPLQVPKVPNTNTPLFSIAGGKWLGAVTTMTTGTLTMQYYDE